MVIALGALALIVIGLFVLLMTGGARLFITALAKLVDGAPLIGGALAGFIRGRINWWVTTIESLGHDALSPLGALFDIWHKPHSLSNKGAQAAAQATATAIGKVKNTSIPHAVTNSADALLWAIGLQIDTLQLEIDHNLSVIKADIAKAEAAAQLEATKVYLWADQAIGQVDTSLTHSIGSVDQSLTAALGSVDSTIHHDLHLLEGWTAGAIDTLRTDVERMGKTAIDYADQVGRDVATYAKGIGRDVYTSVTKGLDAQATGAASALWPTFSGQVRQANDTLTQLFPGLGSVLRNPTEAVPTSMAGLLTGALAGVMTVAESANRCSMPNCAEKNLLASEAHNLSGLVSAGVGLAFLIAAITEPEATARASIDVVDVIATPMVDAVKAII